MNNKTLKYLSTLLVLFLFGCSKSIEKSPNILFILTDDLAYADLSSYGYEFIETPNLMNQSLAKLYKLEVGKLLIRSPKLKL